MPNSYEVISIDSNMHSKYYVCIKKNMHSKLCRLLKYDYLFMISTNLFIITVHRTCYTASDWWRWEISRVFI